MSENVYKIFFAPIQGYTDWIYRRLHNELIGGIDAYFSPFLRLKGDGTIRNKDIRDVDPQLNVTINKSNCQPLQHVPQVLGGKVEDVKVLFEYLVSIGYTRIDVNLGCPFPMIAKRGEGAGMLNWESMGDSVSENPYFESLMALISLYPTLEVSLKMRLGWNKTDQSLKLLTLINNTQLHSVTMHARLGIMGYKGECDLNGFEKFHKGCRHKLIYNGDIVSIADYENIIRRFPGIEGLMIGRGLLSDPTLAMEIKSMNKTKDEKIRVLGNFHDCLFNEYAIRLQGEHQILDKMKSLWDYFLPETDKKLLKKIKKSTRLNSYMSIMDEIFII